MRTQRAYKRVVMIPQIVLIKLCLSLSLLSGCAHEGRVGVDSSLLEKAMSVQSACHFVDIDDYSNNATRCIRAYASVSNSLEDLAEQGTASGGLPKHVIREVVLVANMLIKYEPSQSVSTVSNTRSSIITIVDMADDPVRLDPHYRSPIWQLSKTQ